MQGTLALAFFIQAFVINKRLLWFQLNMQYNKNLSVYLTPLSSFKMLMFFGSKINLKVGFYFPLHLVYFQKSCTSIGTFTPIDNSVNSCLKFLKSGALVLVFLVVRSKKLRNFILCCVQILWLQCRTLVQTRGTSNVR